MGRQIIVDRPFQHLYIDLLGPYPRSKSGNSSLLIVLDKFSKYVLLKPLYKASAEHIIRYLETDVFHIFGVPETILSDNGVQFRSKMFEELLKKYGISHVRTATHSPQVNASERVNRSILAAIRAYIQPDQKDWDKNIGSISSSLRSSVHSSTSYFILFGFQMIQHASAYNILRKLNALVEPMVDVLPPRDVRGAINKKVVEKLKCAHDTHTKRYNIRSKDVSYSPGPTC